MQFVIELNFWISAADTNQYSYIEKVELNDKYLHLKGASYSVDVNMNNDAKISRQIIFENVTVQPFVSLGENVVIWPNVFIGHHTVIQDGVFIGANAAINGHVSVGEHSLIGSNAVIREDITIGRQSIVGAGSILLRSLPACSVCNAGESRIYPLTQEKINKLWPPKTSR